MKKKISILLLTLLVASSLLACGKKAETNEAPKETKKANNTITQVAVDAIAEEAEEEYKFGPAELVCSMPDGFNETDFAGEYIHKSYPKDLSSINYIISESDDDPTLVTEDEFKAQLETEYKDAYGDDVEINITQYDSIVVDGRPGLWIMYNFDFRGDDYNALMVILYNGTESHNITYLQGPGADWMKAFADSAMSIGFKEL